MQNIIGIIFGLIALSLGIGIIISSLYALLYDIRHDYILSATFNIILPPYGILRGIYLFFSYLS